MIPLPTDQHRLQPPLSIASIRQAIRAATGLSWRHPAQPIALETQTPNEQEERHP